MPHFEKLLAQCANEDSALPVGMVRGPLYQCLDPREANAKHAISSRELTDYAIA